MRTLGRIDALWIYPVKSLAPVALKQTRIEREGLPGDRERALIVRDGHARIGKTYRGKEHNLLHLGADPQDALSLAAGRGVTATLETNTAERFFDARPVSLLFDRWVDEASRGLSLELDPQRWRPNVFVRAAADFTELENDLVGAAIEAGDALLRVCETIDRCVTTSYDVQTGEPDPAVLRYVAQERDNVMGVYCVVERAGNVCVGEDLRLRAR
ncbi:MAG: MOSC domain-containing protein [Candidatus Baltobacteraceae bacterium]